MDVVEKEKAHKEINAAFVRYIYLRNDHFQNTSEYNLVIVEFSQFFASVEQVNDKLYLKINITVWVGLNEFWAKTRSKILDDRAVVLDSLFWLILHEIQHFELGHFELLGRDQISEAGGVQEFGLISRPDKPQSRITDIDYLKLERCLELQADHAATDLFLETYSTDEWEELRVRIACIVAVLVLIDVEDSKNNFEHSSHPKAATRIFQLMGHVSEMPLVPAQLKAKEQNTTVNPDDIPSEDEQQAFSKQVAIPAFYDAIALAKAADAEHIIEELGDLPAFFQDVLLAKTNSDGDSSQFKTEGAKEWAELIVINEQLNEVTA